MYKSMFYRLHLSRGGVRKDGRKDNDDDKDEKPPLIHAFELLFPWPKFMSSHQFLSNTSLL